MTRQKIIAESLIYYFWSDGRVITRLPRNRKLWIKIQGQLSRTAQSCLITSHYHFDYSWMNLRYLGQCGENVLSTRYTPQPVQKKRIHINFVWLTCNSMFAIFVLMKQLVWRDNLLYQLPECPSD